MTDPAATLERFSHRAQTLFSLPCVAAEVLELTRDPQVDAGRLKQCIERDPALTVKLLRVVNSSLFGLGQPVADLGQALALLGTKPLKLLVLGFSLPDGLYRGLTGTFLVRYWRHTLIKAVAAREISEEVWRVAGDEAFLAGLLQDLGMLVLVQEMGAPYARFVTGARETGADLCELERAALGFDHHELTARLLAHWNMPEALVAAAACRTPEAVARLHPTHKALFHVLRLADLLATFLSDGRPEVLQYLLHAAWQDHGLSVERLQALVVTLQQKVQGLAEVLSLELPRGRDYGEVLSQAHARLGHVAAEAAADLLGQACQHPHPDQPEAALWADAQTLADAAAAAAGRDERRPAASPDPLAAPGHVRSDAIRPEARAIRGKPPTPGQGEASSRAAIAVLLSDQRQALEERVQTAAVACRAARQPLALLLVELDGFEELTRATGLDTARRLVRMLEACCKAVAPQAQCLETRPGCLALVVPNEDRASAVTLATTIAHRLRAIKPPTAGEPAAAISVSIGVAAVATPARNFSAEDLIQSAQRCLFAAQSAGGGAVKSIET
jgi:diguanylate cyclase (GGDEF)-like protein